MTRQPGEMPSNHDGEFKAVAIVPQGVFYPADGGEPLVETAIYKSENVSKEEVDGIVEDSLGPDALQGKVGRNMAHAAFGTWNSSWETEADRKKRENAHLN